MNCFCVPFGQPGGMKRPAEASSAESRGQGEIPPEGHHWWALPLKAETKIPGADFYVHSTSLLLPVTGANKSCLCPFLPDGTTLLVTVSAAHSLLFNVFTVF